MNPQTIPLSTALATVLWTLAILGSAAGIACLITDHPYIARAIYINAILCAVAGAAASIKACMERAVKAVVSQVEINRDLMPGGPLRKVN